MIHALRCPENAYQALDFFQTSWGRTPRPPFPVIHVLRCPKNAYQALDFSKFPGGGPPYPPFGFRAFGARIGWLRHPKKHLPLPQPNIQHVPTALKLQSQRQFAEKTVNTTLPHHMSLEQTSVTTELLPSDKTSLHK